MMIDSTHLSTFIIVLEKVNLCVYFKIKNNSVYIYFITQFTKPQAKLLADFRGEVNSVKTKRFDTASSISNPYNILCLMKL